MVDDPVTDWALADLVWLDDEVNLLEPIGSIGIALVDPVPGDAVDQSLAEMSVPAPADDGTDAELADAPPACDAPAEGPLAEAPVIIHDDNFIAWLVETFPAIDCPTSDIIDDGSSGENVIAVVLDAIEGAMPIDDLLVDTKDTAGDPGDQSADGEAVDPDSDVVIIRPLDSEPNWRVLYCKGESGIGSDESFPVPGKDAVFDDGAGGDGVPQIVYCMFDPPELQVGITAVTDPEGPDRSFAPLPFERAFIAQSSALEVEVDRTPLHYAACEPFHTGLDLL